MELRKVRSAGPLVLGERPQLERRRKGLGAARVRRDARPTRVLAGFGLREVGGGYSTTIGNTTFPVLDARASAAEIACRGVGAALKFRDVPPSGPR